MYTILWHKPTQFRGTTFCIRDETGVSSTVYCNSFKQMLNVVVNIIPRNTVSQKSG